MYRNLSKRVEVVTPVLARESKERLWEFLEICLRVSRQASGLTLSKAITLNLPHHRSRPLSKVSRYCKIDPRLFGTALIGLRYVAHAVPAKGDFTQG